MNLSTALSETILRSAVVVAGAHALDREISWVHIIDHPEVAEWVRPGQLLLSNGYSWPKDGAAQRQLIEALSERGLVGVVLSVPHFMTHFPPETVEAAERCNLPLLEMPWSINFAQVTEEILAHIVAHQARILERSERIHRELTNVALTATSLDDMASALNGLLGRAVVFTDGEASPLCVAGQPLEVERLRRAISTWLERLCALRQLQEANAAVRFLPPDGDMTPAGLGCVIRIRGELVGIVWLSGDCAALGELDARAAEHAAVIAALHLSHQRELSLQEARLGYAFVDSLLEGRFIASPSSLERAKLCGWNADAPYRVCLVLLDEPMPLSKEGFVRRERWAERLRRKLESMQLPVLLTVTLNQITFLLPAEVPPDKVWAEVSEPGCALAVSRVWQGADGMAAGAADAVGLIPMLRPGKLHQFDEMLFTRVLLGDEKARTVFLARIVEPLRKQRRGEDLLDTLHALADESFQLVQTARRLDIHISTLRYRLDKIQGLLGRSLDDGETRFELQVAMRLCRLNDL